ncbi:MAG: hypothetical protein JWP27_430, partial [Flaviaesturariibacter sp.]|nr:hypothetical protein [Flaviaesturariibacter sp.]
DDANNRLVLMPAYWFRYNMYALARNAHKYIDRDKRTERIQHIEYDYLAPDSVNEIFNALRLLERYAALSPDRSLGPHSPAGSLEAHGKALFDDPSIDLNTIEVRNCAIENNNRPTLITKARDAYRTYRELIIYYAANQLTTYLSAHPDLGMEEFRASLPTPQRQQWLNIGGQLLPRASVDKLISDIKTGAIDSWTDVHKFYEDEGTRYAEQKMQHALASVMELEGLTTADLTGAKMSEWLQQALATKEWMAEGIFSSRAKDYENDFRLMAYDSREEMEEVIGKLEDNGFIRQQREELDKFREYVTTLRNRLS